MPSEKAHQPGDMTGRVQDPARLMGCDVNLHQWLDFWKQAAFVSNFLFLAAGSACMWKVGALRCWPYFLIYVDGIVLGGVAAFLYSTYGQEKRVFEVPVRAINAFIGGAAVADVSRGSTSVILGIIKRIAEDVGLGQHVAILPLLLIPPICIAFVLFYYLKCYLLNPIHQQQESLIRVLKRNQMVLIGTAPKIDSNGNPVLPNADLKDVAREYIGQSKNQNDRDAKFALARSYFYSQQPEQAATAYRELLMLDPNNLDFSYELSAVLVSLNKHLEALPLLQKVTAQKNPPPNSWNLLAQSLTVAKAQPEQVLEAWGRYLDLVEDGEAAVKLFAYLAQSKSIVLTDPKMVEAAAQALRIAKEFGDETAAQKVKTILDQPALSRLRSEPQISALLSDNGRSS